MRSPSSIPASLEVFLDARGDDRALRVSWHAEAAVVVLSLWRAGVCAGTFRMPIADAPALIAMLRNSLEDAYDEARGSFESRQHEPQAPGRHRGEAYAGFEQTDAFDRRGTFLGGFHATEDAAG